MECRDREGRVLPGGEGQEKALWEQDWQSLRENTDPAMGFEAGWMVFKYKAVMPWNQKLYRKKQD